MEEPKTEEIYLQVVVISLNGELYGIKIFAVREILKVKKITWVPCTPESIVGVISVRGDIQAIMDLKHFLQLGFSQITDNSKFLPLTESTMSIPQKYVEEKFPWNDQSITLLNVDTLIQGVVVDQG
jgi:chemotaxis signal transduction protein